MNVNQSQFGAVPGSQQPYLIRNIQPAHNQQQPVQNVMKHSPMPVVQGSVPMQQQRIGGPPSVNANPRSIPNYANSPQINQPASVSNLTAPTPRPGKIDFIYFYTRFSTYSGSSKYRRSRI